MARFPHREASHCRGGIGHPVVPIPLGGGKPDEPAKLEVTVTEVASFATGDTCDTSSTAAKGVAAA
jgi:hypothetical protein